MAKIQHIVKITKPYSLNPSSPDFKGRFSHAEVRDLRNRLSTRTADYVERISIYFNPTISTKDVTVETVVSDSDHLIGVIDEIGSAGYTVRNYSSSSVEEERR